jgi:hypothetical protein
MADFIAFDGKREGAGAVTLEVMLAYIDGTPLPRGDR